MFLGFRTIGMSAFPVVPCYFVPSVPTFILSGVVISVGRLFSAFHIMFTVFDCCILFMCHVNVSSSNSKSICLLFTEFLSSWDICM